MTCHSPLNVENCFHSPDFSINWSWKTTISLLQCSVSKPSLSDLRSTTCDIPIYVQTYLSATAQWESLWGLSVPNCALLPQPISIETGLNGAVLTYLVPCRLLRFIQQRAGLLGPVRFTQVFGGVSTHTVGIVVETKQQAA